MPLLVQHLKVVGKAMQKQDNKIEFFHVLSPAQTNIQVSIVVFGFIEWCNWCNHTSVGPRLGSYTKSFATAAGTKVALETESMLFGSFNLPSKFSQAHHAQAHLLTRPH
jgi:hypothetical protein